MEGSEGKGECSIENVLMLKYVGKGQGGVRVKGQAFSTIASRQALCQSA